MNDPVWQWPAFLGAIVGVVVGSFLATLAIRWPEGRSVAIGRSRCDGCGIAIGWPALVPLASYAWLGGRCRNCRAAIDWRHPLMEAACAAIGALALALHPDLSGVAGALFGWLLAVLALLDRDHFWLPDRLTGALVVVGLVGGLLGLPPALPDRLIGGVAGWAVLAAIAFAYHRLRGREGLGQGDAKLLGAIGLWLGWRALPGVVLGACLIGLGWVALVRLRGRAVARDDQLPLGTLLAVAGWIGWLVLGWPDA